MEIKLTKEQYKTLVEMLYLGEWMINACRPHNEAIKKYQELEQYIYSFAKTAGLERHIEYDEEFKKYFLTEEFEINSEVEEYRLEFEDETFWDELVDRMSLRDMIRQFGEKAVQKMDGMEHFKHQRPFLEKYDREVEEHGIENLEIVSTPKPPSSSGSSTPTTLH